MGDYVGSCFDYLDRGRRNGLDYDLIDMVIVMGWMLQFWGIWDVEIVIFLGEDVEFWLQVFKGGWVCGGWLTSRIQGVNVLKGRSFLLIDVDQRIKQKDYSNIWLLVFRLDRSLRLQLEFGVIND